MLKAVGLTKVLRCRLLEGDPILEEKEKETKNQARAVI